MPCFWTTAMPEGGQRPCVCTKRYCPRTAVEPANLHTCSTSFQKLGRSAALLQDMLLGEWVTVSSKVHGGAHRDQKRGSNHRNAETKILL